MMARRPKQIARVARREQTQVIARKLDLTVQDDPVADALDTKPGKVDPRYRKYHDPFMVMIRAATSPYQKKFGVLAVILDWWSVAFPGRPFPPSKRTTGNELVLAMQYALLMKGYTQYGIAPPARFTAAHDIAADFRFGDLPDRLQTVLDYDETTTLGRTIIQPKPESKPWQQSSAPNPPKPIARRPRRR